MGILTLIERVIDMMGKNQLAQLDSEQLQEISELEAKIGVTLVAYDSMATLDEIPPPSPS